MEKREGKHWLNSKKTKLNLCTKTLGEHFLSLFICLPSQFGWLFPSHFHTINWITQFHQVPEMGSCCIPSFPSSIFPLTFCLSRSDPVTLTVISGWSAGWGLFCELPTLAKCAPVWGKPPACVLATPLGNAAWSPQAREDMKRISREATANGWDGFTIWISFSHKNKLFMVFEKTESKPQVSDPKQGVFLEFEAEESTHFILLKNPELASLKSFHWLKVLKAKPSHLVNLVTDS